MGNQTFMYLLKNGNARLSITKRLYNEIIADTNGKDYNEARGIILTKIMQCPKEVQKDTSNKKSADIEI
jgi:hypothetical protein